MEYVIKNSAGDYLCENEDFGIDTYAFDSVCIDNAARFETYEAAYKVALDYKDAVIRTISEEGETDYIEQVKEKGLVEIQDGVWLWTAEAIQSEQKEWSEEDQSKTFDFSTAPFWVTDNTGMKPEPIHDEKDLLALF